jgi:hypothetical protein
MSYLDLPRLHFSGLFFTGPGTINNRTQNYTPSVPLVNAAGQYLRTAVWNPLGVSQWWLEECTVLSAVGSAGAPVDATDAVIGAAVESPSPMTPMSDGADGFYDIAKMVDLDPDQQGRSALYGVRIAVTLPNGAGLQGLMTIAELRQLYPRVPVRSGSWTAVGNWMGTLQNVQWSGDISGSALLTALKGVSAQGLAVKLSVDLHQNNPGNNFTSGDKFCYGRVLGSIGPALAGELDQVVPGRYLPTFSGPPSAAVEAAPRTRQVISAREGVAMEAAAIAVARDAASASEAATPLQPWNPAFAVIRQSESQTLLNIDIGGCILLNGGADPNNPSGFSSDGTFEVDSGIVVGVFDGTNDSFVPLTNGSITLSTQYQPLESTSKNCNLVKNSGVFTIPLTEADGTGYQTNPLGIQVNGTTVVQENADGLWADVSVSSQRLECGSGQTGQAKIMVRVFGNAPPVGTAPPVTIDVQLVEWLPNDPQPPSLGPSTDVGLTIGQTDANGLADITTSVNVPDITLSEMRQPLASQVYYITLTDPLGNAIGDGTPLNLFQSPTLSVLLWQAFQAPATPTWSDIGPIFTAYARLYPGMKSRLDISDEATVVGFAPVVLAMMSKDITDPSYMPVTRDLSPSKMAMIVSWLKQVSQK